MTAGFDPATGQVALMLHTFVGPDEAAVRNVVRGPLKAYLGTSLNLLKQYAWAFPAFKRPKNASLNSDKFAETFGLRHRSTRECVRELVNPAA